MLKPIRLSPVALLAMAALAVWPAMASAESSGAHFFADTSASIANSGALTVHIDEAGLGGTETHYSLSAEASFQPKHGRVQADMSAGPISAGSFKCPGGQKLVLAAVSYSNIVLTDTTNNVTDNLGSLSRTFIAF